MNARGSRRWLLVGFAGAAVWLALAWSSAWQKSPAMDEVPHIGAGLSYIAHRDYRMNPEHPVPFKALCALPIYLIDPPNMAVANIGGDPHLELADWHLVRQWNFGFDLLYMREGNAQRRVMLARVVPMLVGVLGMALAWWWGWQWRRSHLAGATAAGLMGFLPEYLGHARFVTLDVPLLVACAGISAATWWWWKRPGFWRGAVFVAAAVAGSYVKLPAIVFSVVCVLVLLVLAVMRSSGRGARLRAVVLLALVTLLAGYVGCWAASGFRFSIVSGTSATPDHIPHVTILHQVDAAQAGVLQWVHRRGLLPEATLATLAHVSSFEDRRMFFMGRTSMQGWYSYFLVTTLLKTPQVVLVGWILMLGEGLRHRRRLVARTTRAGYRRERLAILLVPFAVLLAMVVVSRVNIGHRHILFAFFPLSIVMGAHVATWWRRGRAWRLGVMAGALALVGSIALTYPHYETYFNAVGGSPYRASSWVGDSNIDWGTDLPALGRELRRLDAPGVNLALFTAGDWEAYGLTQEWRFVLPNYPHVVATAEHHALNNRWPTAVSLNAWEAAALFYPQYLDREPDIVLNSIVIFLPQ